ncbi:helix-turn-helix domain-containing protein [Paenibacillus silvisoli]|uniref:helix-turn-helix domain-containing protein n=1 Tax=Paenibacillus silvisoli TaxID=3110539 RepID=UPI0028064B74|nr:AraC family transcriptional regulator [Paenibacillus silvisoli]
MRLFKIYQSKKYLLRILLSITVLTVIFLVGSSATLFYTSKNSVIEMQKQYNEATLAQINFNINAMEEIAKNMVSALFWDVQLRPLMSNQEVFVFDLTNKIHKMDTVVNTTSFLDSIIVYNGYTDQIYAGGNAGLKTASSEQSQHMLEFLRDSDAVQKMKFIPMKLKEKSTGIDVFSFVMYESLGKYNPVEGALVLNIKPEWLFNNLKLINGLGVEKESSLLLMNKEGQVLYANNGYNPSSNGYQDLFSDSFRENKTDGYMIQQVDDQKQIISYSKLIIPNWYLVSVQPYDAVIHNIEQIRKTTIGLTVVFLLLSIIAAIFVSRRLYKPIDRLMNQIQKNQFGLGAPSAKDELDYLSEVYSKVVDNLQDMRKLQQDNRDIIDSYYIRQLLTSSKALSQEQFAGIIRSNRVNIQENGSYVVVFFAIDNHRTISHLLQPSQMKLFHFAIMNIAEELIGSRYRCAGAELRSDHLALIVSAEHDLGETIGLLKEKVVMVQETVHRYYKITISAALSESAFHFTDISKQAHQAQQIILYKPVFGRNALLSLDSVEENMRNTNESIPPELEKKLVEGINSDDAALLEDTLEKLIRHIASCNYDQIMTAITQIPLIIRQTLKEINQNRVQPIEIDIKAVSLSILEMDSLDDIHRQLWQTLHEIIQQKRSGLVDRNDILVETIKEIVKQNYNDVNLSLQSIAGMMKLSADYVGRLFRKNELISVADYINEVRLGIARELLEHKNHSVYEIMVQTGFANQSYFFRLFKKKLGCTPGEYRLKKSLQG